MLRQQTGIVVALGEAERTRCRFRELLIREAVDIIRAGVGRTGLSEYLSVVEHKLFIDRSHYTPVPV